MNKLSKFTLIVALSVAAVSCDKYDEFGDNLGTGVRSKFLVDKIYNYHNSLLAEYIYDDNNRLIKRIVKDTLVEPNGNIYRRWENEFQYKNGRVSKMKNYNLYIDKRTFATGEPQESRTEATFEYNSQGRLIKSNGELLNFRYENGHIVGSSIENDQWIHSDTMVYDNFGNIIEHIRIVPELTMFGEPIPCTAVRTVRYYEYDNKPKPNFGLDYLFVFNPFPYTQGPDLTRALSQNNMTKATEDGYAFIYTYNEKGLPTTIETKWLGIETLEPMLLRITYKQIE